MSTDIIDDIKTIKAYGVLADWFRYAMNLLLKLILVAVFLGILIPILVFNLIQEPVLSLVACIRRGIDKITGYTSMVERIKNKHKGNKNV
ncbi:MAG: hypothetical protein RR382_00565 [Tannerellaceae bacterium]